MKKLILILIAGVLLLSSCGGSSLPPVDDFDTATKDGLADYVKAVYAEAEGFSADDVTVNDDAGSDEAKFIILANVTYSGDKTATETSGYCKDYAKYINQHLKNAEAPVSDLAVFYETPHGSMKVAFEDFELADQMSDF